ncbi:MAG: CehA/McbA family metallohydrolase [Dehalococcoidia bacterium]
MRQTQSFEGWIDPGSQPAGSYLYVPFHVPEGATNLTVSYHYEGAGDTFEGTGGNVIDAGLFDQRGTDLISGGFRGYSGSSRQSFYLARDVATPGYLAGPLQAGDWNLMLGVAELLPAGARWWATVEVDSDPGSAEPAQAAGTSPAFQRRRSGRGRWVPGDLHSHTEHSDGYNSVAELAAYSQEVGLQYLAVTDHNTISHQADVARCDSESLLVFPGEEVTTYYGHANVWGLRDWIDFRCRADQDLRQIVDFVHGRGKLFSVNHPKKDGPDWRFEETVFDCVEVWQAPWRWRNDQSLALWSSMLREGRRVVGVGGSDIHAVPPAKLVSPHGPGNPCTWVWVDGELSEATVLDAVRAGHIVISESAMGPFLSIAVNRTMPGDEARVASGPLTVLLGGRGLEGRTLRLLFNEDEVWRKLYDIEETLEEVEVIVEHDGPLRAELWGLRGREERGEVMWAMTNPIWLKVA